MVFVLEPDVTKAFERLKANDIQVYFSVITDPSLARRVQEEGLAIDYAYGGYSCLVFNIVNFTTGELNPFVNTKIREAVNYIIDRDYIVKEIYGGMGKPKYTPIERVTSDYARYIDVIKEVELAYKYDFGKGKAIIQEEMLKMGAQLIDGKWYYGGKPVTLKFMIRITGREFSTLGRATGDYIAEQFEKLGFTVEKRYMEAPHLFAELAKDPREGTWHMYYSGYMGWVGRFIDYYFFWWYSPGGYPQNLVWGYLKPSPEFEEIINKLSNKNYTSWGERDQLMRRGVWLAMNDTGVGSFHVWVASAIYFNMRRPEVVLTPDIAAGYPMSYLWPYTIRYVDRTGGSVRAAAPSLLEQPMNPVIGALTVYDVILYVATVDYTLRQDPFTGLQWPNVIKKAEVYVAKDVAPLVTTTLGWVDLRVVDKIEVPTDAWYDWNVTTKSVIYAPPGTTAKSKVVLYYEDDLFDKWVYHDGSKLSLVDFLIWYPLWFERCSPESPHYDESISWQCGLTRKNFKGLRILSEKPLIIEVYLDMWEPDAEIMVSDAVGMPGAGFPGLPWHTVALGMLAEVKKQGFFTSYNADKYKAVWLNYLAGESITILKSMAEDAISTRYIPFKELLGKWIKEEDAVARYQSALKWILDRGHLWIGSGPFYLDSVKPVEKIVVLKANRNYPYLADRWAGFQQPPIPVIKIKSAPSVIEIGGSATIDLSVSRPDGSPYETEYIKEVLYIVFQKEAIAKGEAKPVGTGVWRIELTPSDTAKLEPGSLSLVLVAVSKLANLPAEEETVLLAMAPTTPTTPPATPIATIMTVTKTVTIEMVSEKPVTTTVEVPRTEWGISAALAVVCLIVGLLIGWFVISKRK